ncbi:hypothetical protein Droror1_Dr00018182 [Drosera rotundifolia]
MGLLNWLTDSARLALALTLGEDDGDDGRLYSIYSGGDSNARISLALAVELGLVAVGSRGKMFEEHNKICETRIIERLVIGSSNTVVVIRGSLGCASSSASSIANAIKSTGSDAEESWKTSSSIASGLDFCTAHCSVATGRGVDGCGSSCGGGGVGNCMVEVGGDGEFVVEMGAKLWYMSETVRSLIFVVV